MTRASHVLATVSHGLGIIIAPPLGQIVLEFIPFMVLPDNRLLVVLVSGGGRTRDKLLHLERTFLQAELDETAQYLNTEYRGWTLNAIRVNLQTTLARDRERYDKLRTDALLLCDPALLGGDERTQVYVEGAAQIATAADFADERELGELLGAIEQRQRLVTLLYGIAKCMLDGPVDGKTAYMLEPYVGGGKGEPFLSRADLNATVTKYDKAGFQVETHAIGDGAVRMTLDAYEHAAKVNGTSGRRHRVEHIEVPALADLPRFRKLGVIASTQAIFALPDANTLANYEPLLGPGRASHANAFKLFDDAGAVQAFGSDYPVFPMYPILGIYTAVTRMTRHGTPAGGD